MSSCARSSLLNFLGLLSLISFGALAMAVYASLSDPLERAILPGYPPLLLFTILGASGALYVISLIGIVGVMVRSKVFLTIFTVLQTLAALAIAGTTIFLLLYVNKVGDSEGLMGDVEGQSKLFFVKYALANPPEWFAVQTALGCCGVDIEGLYMALALGAETRDLDSGIRCQEVGPQTEILLLLRRVAAVSEDPLEAAPQEAKDEAAGSELIGTEAQFFCSDRLGQNIVENTLVIAAASTFVVICQTVTIWASVKLRTVPIEQGGFGTYTKQNSGNAPPPPPPPLDRSMFNNPFDRISHRLSRGKAKGVKGRGLLSRFSSHFSTRRRDAGLAGPPPKGVALQGSFNDSMFKLPNKPSATQGSFNGSFHSQVNYPRQQGTFARISDGLRKGYQGTQTFLERASSRWKGYFRQSKPIEMDYFDEVEVETYRDRGNSEQNVRGGDAGFKNKEPNAQYNDTRGNGMYHKKVERKKGNQGSRYRLREQHQLNETAGNFVQESGSRYRLQNETAGSFMQESGSRYRLQNETAGSFMQESGSRYRLPNEAAGSFMQESGSRYRLPNETAGSFMQESGFRHEAGNQREEHENGRNNVGNPDGDWRMNKATGYMRHFSSQLGERTQEAIGYVRSKMPSLGRPKQPAYGRQLEEQYRAASQRPARAPQRPGAGDGNRRRVEY